MQVVDNNAVLKGFTLTGCTWSGEILTNDYTLAEMRELYTNGVPRVRTAPSVDKGYASAYDLLRATATDASGVSKRMANGTLDIGAYEYDWYADYSKALGRRVTVTNATAMVIEDNTDKVSLSPDNKLAFTRAGSAHGAKYSIAVTLNGGVHRGRKHRHDRRPRLRPRNGSVAALTSLVQGCRPRGQDPQCIRV